MANILEKCKTWQKAGPKILADVGADRFYDTVFDGSALPYAVQVRARLERLAALYNWPEPAAEPVSHLEKERNPIFRWVLSLISSGSPHVLRVHMGVGVHRTCCEPNEIELTSPHETWHGSITRSYGDRDDIGGVTLQRQTLIPKLRQWRKFVAWTRSIDLDTFDVSTPGLVASQWWNALDNRHIWTQHFVYFTQQHDLYTLYVNLPGTTTLAAHMRDKGEHFATALGQDFPQLQTDMPFQFPGHPVKYDWGGTQVPADNTPH